LLSIVSAVQRKKRAVRTYTSANVTSEITFDTAHVLAHNCLSGGGVWGAFVAHPGTLGAANGSLASYQSSQRKNASCDKSLWTLTKRLANGKAGTVRTTEAGGARKIVVPARFGAGDKILVVGGGGARFLGLLRRRRGDLSLGLSLDFFFFFFSFFFSFFLLDARELFFARSLARSALFSGGGSGGGSDTGELGLGGGRGLVGRQILQCHCHEYREREKNRAYAKCWREEMELTKEVGEGMTYFLRAAGILTTTTASSSSTASSSPAAALAPETPGR
jgi:hypothetical protein